MTSDSESSTPTATSILSAEIKELRNKIMSVKKSVTKGDKKQKKAVQDELTALEALLLSKQEELQKMKSVVVEESNEAVEEERINKAKLKRERRKEEKEAEWEANRQAALAEIANRPDLALEESKAFSHRLAQEGFRILEVSADGHCLFSSIGCQLNPPMDHWELRKLAANYLREHRADYECFLELEAVETVGDEDKFEAYCHKLESTGMWGGQIELEILSRVLNITIIVLQSEGPELKFNSNDSEDGEEKRVIYLSFHRYAFSLGEHYNALLRIE